MAIKSTDICEDDLEPNDPEIIRQLSLVLAPIPDSLYDKYVQVPNLSSANILVMFKTLKMLRKWRSQAIKQDSPEDDVKEIFDILRLK
jgi:hypothetical protein